MALDYDSNSPRVQSGTTAKLIAAWLIVGVPAAWGVAQTVQKSLPLFTSPTNAVAPTTLPVK